MSGLRYRPVRLRHVGVVQADGLWIDGAALGEGEARRRVRGVWRPGASVWRTNEGLLVRFSLPIRVDTRESVGLAVVRDGPCLSTFPVHPADRAGLADGTFVRLNAGRFAGTGSAELRREDPSTWLDLGDVVPIDVVPLGDPPPQVAIGIAPITADVRSRLGIGADGALAVSGLADALARIVPSMRPPASVAAAGARMLTGAAALLGRLGGAAARAGAPGAGRLSGWVEALDTLGRKLGLDAVLGGLLGEQHASYLAKMMSLFDRGDLGEALRHAIPLSGVPADPSFGGGWLTWLMPRGGLGFSGAGGGGGSSIATDGGLFAYLKQLYRRAFEALDAQGRVKEAAYVLGELLAEHHEAVTYLEGHGEHRLAAEMAETKALDPGLVVLLWLRAGDRERAISLARLRSGWTAAVEGLERRGLAREAQELRWVWAVAEARAGRHASAVAIAWVAPELRGDAAPWLDRAIAGGGIAGARALARKVQLLPERREEVREAYDRVLGDTDLGAEHVRRELATELATNGDIPSLRLLTQVARALVRDAERSPSAERERLARETAGREKTLAADLPRISVAGPRTAPSTPQVFAVGEGDTGTVPIHDVLPLPRGELLLALGELGARLVGPDGRTRTTFSAPTHRLVPNPLGTRVMLMGRRGPSWRLARLDTETRTVAPWCDARLETFAPIFDGAMWFVVEDGRLVALDAASDGLRALWSVGGLAEPAGLLHRGTRIAAVGVEATGLFVVTAGEGAEWFRYELPGLLLRERRGMVIPPGTEVAVATSRGFLAVGPGRSAHVGGVLHLTVEGVVRAAWSSGDIDACEVHTREGVSITVSQPHAPNLERRAQLLFPGASRAGARVGERWVAVWDDLGRVRVLDLEDDTLRVDLRI